MSNPLIATALVLIGGYIVLQKPLNKNFFGKDDSKYSTNIKKRRVHPNPNPNNVRLVEEQGKVRFG